MIRDADRTRAKILAAAIAEFGANGYAGARIDRIAARAGVNKRMIYHHFGGKQAIFEAVLANQLTTSATTADLVRLWMHEALERGDENIVGWNERRKLAVARVGATRASQAQGEVGATLDPSLLTLARLALDVFPLAFPQIVRVIVGNRAVSAEFGEAWKGFLQDWPEPRTRQRAKPRIRLDHDGVAKAATRPPLRRQDPH